MNQQFLEELRKITDGNQIYENEPMSLHTTFRVGGPADALVKPSESALPLVIKLCRKYQEPYFIKGNGSNLLVGDRGIRGLVIEMSSKMEDIFVEGEQITAGAGVLLAKAAGQAAAHGLSGMEFAAGIPGSIGGAVVMNAGAYGGEMKDIIECVTVLDPDGNKKVLDKEELDFGYRKSCITEKDYIVTKAVLKLSVGKQETIRGKMEEYRAKRLEKQPLQYASAGSTFKRPEGHYAGKLIMDAGLRGYQVGAAQVSEKHCGFVINRGGATAAEIRQLMQEVSEQVREKYGVTLEPEVKMIGEFL